MKISNLIFCAVLICNLLFFQKLYSQKNRTNLQLKLTNTVQKSNCTTVIYFTQGATDGWDPKYDGYMFMNYGTDPNIYSIIPGYDLAVNALPPLTIDKLVKLGVECDDNNNSIFFIKADSINNFNNTTKIFLIDSLLNKVRMLTLVARDSFIYLSKYPNRFSVCFDLEGIGPPTSSFTIIPSPVQVNDTALVTYTGNASADGVFTWDFGDATIISGNGAGPYKIVWNSTGQKSVSLSVSRICYSSPKTTNNINVKLLTHALITPEGSTTLCKNSSVILETNSTGIGYSYVWKKNSKTIPGASNNTYTADSSGSYIVIITNADTSITSNPIILKTSPFPAPVVNLGKDTSVCQWSSFTLNAGNGYSSYKWSNGDTTKTINLNTSVAGIFDYYITVTNSSGCSASDSIKVTFQVCTTIPDFNNDEFFQLYPNPNHGSFTLEIKLPSDGNVTLEAYNILGEIVQGSTFKVQSPLSIIHYQLSITTGIYFLKIKTNSESYIRKVIIQ